MRAQEPSRKITKRSGGPGRLRAADGAQLLEFAFVLPMLLVLAVGAFDFGRAYNLKQKLTNAAREGARIATNQPTADLTSTSCPSTSSSGPCTVGAVRNAVVNYLNSENLGTSFIATNPTLTGPLKWTYPSTTTGAPILVIERSVLVPVTVGGTTTVAVSTRVTLNYPFSWGFAQVIRLLVPSASYSGSFTISTDVLMKNLT